MAYKHETCWGSAFSHALPKALFLGFCLVACRLSVFQWVPKATPRRFESFAGHGFAWLGGLQGTLHTIGYSPKGIDSLPLNL